MEAFIRRSWRGSLDSNHWAAPELAGNLSGYLEAGRLFILFDALNEMPADGFAHRAGLLRDFIEQWQAAGNRFVVTCRVLDYGQQLQGLQRVEVQPFSDEQIQTLLQKVLDSHWPKMWRALTGDNSSDNRKSKIVNPKSLLEMARNPYVLTMMVSEFVRRKGRLSSNRAELMTGFTDTLLAWAKRKPHLQAIWLDRAVQREALSVTAFEMQQRRGSGAAMETRHVRKFIPAEVRTDPACPPDPIPDPDRILTLAAGANIIELPVDRGSVRFYHQLLQEYFSARELLRRVDGLPSPPPSLPPSTSSGRSLTGEGASTSPPAGGIEGGLAEKLWRWPWLESEMPSAGKRGYSDPLPPPPPTNWEETTILAAGLAPENDAQLVRALLAVNPVLAGRCLYEGQAKVDAATRQRVIDALLATIARPEVALRVRIAAGQVLGDLGDPRLGQFSAIPPGEFVMGGEGQYDGKPQHTLKLPYGYLIGQYPLTNAEYAPFIEAGGYRERRWWMDTGWQEKEKRNWSEPSSWRDSRFNRPSQPVVGVSWYEAVAFCRWQTEQLAVSGQLSAVRDQLLAVSGQAVKDVVVRLATEAEWEKAARGTDGRVFPWGDEFDAARVNMGLGEQQVNATTPVGLYPGGRSPYGLYDCSGNVWEWCATGFKEYPYEIEDEWCEDYLDRTNVSVRVLRGGSWYVLIEDLARCAYRGGGTESVRDIYAGFRVVVSPIF
ncbi:MAG: hypothetical protein Kow0031_34990 [Anaerolineae bacterium]